MEEIVKSFALNLSRFVEAAAAVIIGIGAIKSFWFYIRRYLNPSHSIPSNDIRLSLGRTLTLALEFLLAADIVRTAVAPSWDDIGKLAAIAVLRTGLNFFLEKELNQTEMKEETKLAKNGTSSAGSTEPNS